MGCDDMPLQQKRYRENTTRELIYNDFSAGLNYRDNPSLIAENQSPELQNVRVRDGTINKRPGYKRLYPTSLGEGKINGISPYVKADGSKYRLIAHGTKLYSQSGSDQPVEIKSGLANAKATFFVLSDALYMKNGINYISFDGTTVTDVTTIAYKPLVLIGRSPSGVPNAGTTNESFNLLSAGFRISFSADGTATSYTVPYTNLDATTVTAVVNGVTITEGSGLTVNRTTGVITFTTAPAIGTNNVIIAIHKTSLIHPEYIQNCTIAEVYGGKTSATVFFSGNPNFPDQIWHSRLYGENYNADYFPDDAWQKVTGNVSGLAHIYDLLYVSHSKGHGFLSYIDGEKYPIFPYAEINSQVGSDISGSIQEIDNSIVCASSTNGVLQVLSNTTVNNRLSVNQISQLINKGGIENLDLGLLNQPNLKDAISYNFDNYYGLCVNNICYVLDTKTGIWLYDTNIPASCFTEIDGTLCFGSNTEGIIYQFNQLFVSDDGVAIDAWYDTREENAGTPSKMKIINKVDLLAKPLTKASVQLSFRSMQNNNVVVLQTQTNSFSFLNFGFVGFTFNTLYFPILKRKRMSKRANYFQFRFSNNVINEGMSVVSLRIEYDQGSEMR